jgi:DNA polymerase III delta prime subunit
MFDVKNLHHAYLIEGNIENSLEKVKDFLKNDLKIVIQGNIDLFERVYEKFGIAEAREIKDFLVEKPLGKYKIFLLGIPSMTGQSGNALLKSLEEPPPGTHFFISVPNTKRILPTLLSRAVVIKSADPNNSNELIIDAGKFLKLKSEKRLEEVKNILDLYDKEKINKQDIVYFLSDVIDEYKNKKEYDREVLKRAIVAFDYAGDTSSSLKIILEYVSLTL